MTRRELAALAAAAAAPRVAAQSQYGAMLWDYIREYLRVLDERRARRLEALQSEADFRELRGRVRAALGRMWGEFPSPSPLQSRHVGALDQGDFLIERILFESRPAFPVTAHLYRPAGTREGLPALIFPCGHAAEGKAGSSYQRFCRLMARQGLAVLTWDPLGQGERLQFADPQSGEARFRAGSGEHRILGDRCYLVGENLMQYRAWDAMRALDYLATRPEIDTGRIGIAGQSGGGMTALQFACFDDRIQAAFISCAVASFRAKTEALLIADPEQVLYGTLGQGIDHPELLAAFAPKPLMIGAALRDYVPVAGARRTHRELQSVYARLAAPESLHWAETDAGHGLNRDLREAAARFFAKALAGGATAVREEDEELPSPEDLRCTDTGQVATSFAVKGVQDFMAEKADASAPEFAKPTNASEFDVFRSQIAHRIREVTRVGAFKSEFGIDVPTRFMDAGVYAKGTVFLVAEQGKDHPVVRRYCIDAVVSANYSIFGVDVRGWGVTKPALPDLQADFDWDDFLAYRSLELGRPLFGQRLKDLLATAPKMTKRREWLLVGVGIGGLLAAHAAVLDPRVAGVAAIQAPLSYRSILDDSESTQPVSCLLPGVLGAYDIGDMLAAVAPRPLLVVNPVDPRRNPLPAAAARDQCAQAAGIYEMLEAGGSLRIESGLGPSGIRSTLEEWLDGLKA